MEKEDANAMVLRFSAIVFLKLILIFLKENFVKSKNKLNKIIKIYITNKYSNKSILFITKKIAVKKIVIKLIVKKILK